MLWDHRKFSRCHLPLDKKPEVEHVEEFFASQILREIRHTLFHISRFAKPICNFRTGSRKLSSAYVCICMQIKVLLLCVDYNAQSNLIRARNARFLSSKSSFHIDESKACLSFSPHGY